MSEYLRNVLPGVFLGALCLLGMLPYAPELFSQSPYSAFPLQQQFWTQVAHQGTLAVHPWLLPIEPMACVALALVTAFLAPVLFIEESFPLAARCAPVAVAAVILLIGLDPVVLGALLGFTLFVGAIRLWVVGSFPLAYPFAVLLATGGAICTASLALPIFFLALIFVHCTASETIRLELPAQTAAGLLILLIPVLLITWGTPEPFFPAYPFTPQRTPLAASFASMQPIDRDFIRSVFGRTCLLLVCYIPVAALLLLRKSVEVRLVCLLIFTLCCLLVDTRLPENFSEAGPLAGLSRLVPGLHFLPLAPVITALFFYIAIPALSRSWVSATIAVAGGIAIPFFVSSSISPSMPLPTIRTQMLQLPASCQHARVAATASLRHLTNPALAYLCETGPTIKLPVSKNNASLSSSLASRPKRLRRIMDGSERTRWHAARKQRGDEWLQIQLKTPVSIAGLELVQGRWPADVPEKPVVLLADTCDGTVQFHEPKLLADIRFTPDGYPFQSTTANHSAFSWQATTAGCIRIEQRGIAPRPWSVAEIHVFVTAPPAESGESASWAVSGNN